MQPTPGSSQTAGLDILPIEHLPEYVAGFPVFVAVTIRAQPGVSFSGLLFADFTNLRQSIGVELSGASSHSFKPKPLVGRDLGRPPQQLSANETRRMLVDISEILDPDLREGEYSVRISYVTPEDSVTAEPASLRFRRATAAEEALRARLAPDREKFDDWVTWSMRCSEQAVAADQLKSAGPLTFDLMLRHLLCGGEPLRETDPGSLDVLGGIFAPERDAFKAELYQLRGDSANYQRLREQILKTTPGLAWWVRRLDDNAGYLKSFSTRPVR